MAYSYNKLWKILIEKNMMNKALYGAVVKSLDEYYGGILEPDDSPGSHLLSCDYNLSPIDVIDPMQKAGLLSLSQGMKKYVIPLLDFSCNPFPARYGSFNCLY